MTGTIAGMKDSEDRWQGQKWAREEENVKKKKSWGKSREAEDRVERKQEEEEQEREELEED